MMELDVIFNKIFEIRGQRVMLDFHLAELYGVETKVLKQTVRRNIERFPSDFMFEISLQEYSKLRSQFVTLDWKSIKYALFAFTELGVAMLSSVLKSTNAINVNIEIMRAFVSLRKLALNYTELVSRIDILEAKFDHQFTEVFQALRYLIEPPKKARKRIGF
ncbi:MAG: ORF6N domain-containing protein, partial [Prolixibacteraceae bacterium]|nr:ORF6N domain-containing protein [Prolixibacteraceae bacterium]